MSLPLLIGLGAFLLVLVVFVPVIIKSMKLMGSAQDMMKNMAQGAQQTSDILLNGRSAMAKVLRVDSTGALVNYQPMASVQLEIQGSNPYQVTIQTVIPQVKIPQVQPGATVAVKIDPNNDQNVVIDFQA